MHGLSLIKMYVVYLQPLSWHFFSMIHFYISILGDFVIFVMPAAQNKLQLYNTNGYRRPSDAMTPLFCRI